MKRRSFLTQAALAAPLLPMLNPLNWTWTSAAPFVVKAGASRYGNSPAYRGKNPNDLKISAKDTHGQLAVFEYIGKEKAGPSLHAHVAQEEIFYVERGSYTFQLGTEFFELNAGDLIFLPRDIPHTWIQKTDEGQMHYLFLPAGKMEEFFEGKNRPGPDAPKSLRDQYSLDHGIRNVGPGLDPKQVYHYNSIPSHGFIVRHANNRKGSTNTINGKSENYLKISGGDTADQFALFEYHGHEQGGPPLHIHPDQDEVFYVLEGQYRFVCGNEKFELGPGDLIFLPRNVPHTWGQISEHGKLLFYFQPAGKMEAFFNTLGSITAPPTPEQGAKVFANHGMQVLGPPMNWQ